jgi:OTU domain-containing protein 6
LQENTIVNSISIFIFLVLQLQALSVVLKRPIEVLQAEGAPVLLGEEFKPMLPIILTYHRHVYGLGEHYNSVKPIATEQG